MASELGGLHVCRMQERWGSEDLHQGSRQLPMLGSVRQGHTAHMELPAMHGAVRVNPKLW